MSSQLRLQENELRRRHGKDIDFVVKVRDGKAIVKAVHKRD